MPLKQIHSFLVHPSKHEDDQPAIGGTKVPLGGPLASMLRSIYFDTPKRSVEIIFTPTSGGVQQNDCRDALVEFAKTPNVPNGRKIAARLQAITTKRSGLGLLFLMYGKEGGTNRLVVARFPADQGVVAEERREKLSVQFIERVFMKSAKAYKSVHYEADSLGSKGMWDGRALDLQIDGPREISDYWIRDFLMSDFKTTAEAGTKRVALTLKQALNAAPSLEVRSELTAAAQLMRGHDGRNVTARGLLGDLGLSDEAQAAFEKAIPRSDLMDERFTFSRSEFDLHLLYRSVELDNGALLTAEDARFSEVFTAEEVTADRVRYSTEGRVVDESLKKGKRT